MKKAIILSLMLVTTLIDVDAQDFSKEELIKQKKNKYAAAMRYNDFSIAKSAIYDLLLLEPTNTSYLDSLAFMYFEFKQYPSAALTSSDALKANPNNQYMLQIAAASFDNLGAQERSLTYYQKLYNLSDDPYTLYEVILKQYGLSQYDDAMLNTEILLTKPSIQTVKVGVQNEEGKEIQVFMKAVIYNTRGLIEKDRGNLEAAKENFKKAIELSPNYVQAENNRNSL